MNKSFLQILTQAPTALGYRMPAEWEPHAATWIAWPHYENDWPGKFEAIPWVFAEIARAITAGEALHIAVQGARSETTARKILRDSKVPLRRVQFHRWPTDRVWTRDSGPIFVKRGSRAGNTNLPPVIPVGWGFNAWAKYPNWKKDCRLPRRIARELKLPLVEPRIKRSLDHKVILEGGSIDVNGQGTLLTTEECLLSRAQQRNPGMSRQQWERLFAEYLAVRKVIWLGAGIAGDDTHGHVDDIARFVGPRTVAAAVERDPTDVNYKPLRENLRRLRRAKDQAGRQLEILELPMPSPVIFKGQRLPASYANFYIANAAVLVPVFNDANDRIALELLQRVFRKRKVVGIYCGDLIWGFGAIHCMTQQQPA